MYKLMRSLQRPSWLLSLMLTAATTGIATEAIAADNTPVADASAGQTKTATCAACHGMQGISPASAFPHLAGQQAHYLRKQIADIRDGRRSVPQMAGTTDSLSDQDIADIAAHYAALPAHQGQAEPEAAAKGEVLYRAGSLTKGIAACTACHGPRGKGLDAAGYPALAGQFPQYTVAALQAFRAGTRDNDPNAIMSTITAQMSDSDMQQVAEYLHGLR
ncbi:c-type cytochrome [Cobetia sp. L2A1]|uniref:c-type cytochrome n=1 Tax=Cobetia sp. L2A1 TaxID=2686360 RepID=UPI001E4091B5|nr:c-type cytochrome [Cobetia sp. L2A1]